MQSLRIFPLILVLFISGCSSIQGKSKNDKQAYINSMRTETLAMLFRAKPSTEAQLENSAGYAVFSNINSNIIFLSAGSGYGVVRDNDDDSDTYMRMASAGIGPGLGIKDFRAVIIFENHDSLKKFIKDGWDFTGQADAAAKSGDKGGELIGGVANANLGITVYQLTESGLVAQATLQGTKYWVDEGLN